MHRRCCMAPSRTREAAPEVSLGQPLPNSSQRAERRDRCFCHALGRTTILASSKHDRIKARRGRIVTSFRHELRRVFRTVRLSGSARPAGYPRGGSPTRASYVGRQARRNRRCCRGALPPWPNWQWQSPPLQGKITFPRASLRPSPAAKRGILTFVPLK